MTCFSQKIVLKKCVRSIWHPKYKSGSNVWYAGKIGHGPQLMPVTRLFFDFFPIWPNLSHLNSDKNRVFCYISPLYYKSRSNFWVVNNRSWVLVDAHRFFFQHNLVIWPVFCRKSNWKNVSGASLDNPKYVVKWVKCVIICKNQEPVVRMLMQSTSFFSDNSIPIWPLFSTRKLDDKSSVFFAHFSPIYKSRSNFWVVKNGSWVPQLWCP